MLYLADQSFYYKGDVLYVDCISCLDILAKIDTPFYCYSRKSIERNYLEFSNNLPSNALICYAVKANSNLSIVRLLGKLGAGAEVVSEGELRKVIMAGIPAEKIVFSGVGKTADEIRYALDCRILQFNVESIEELYLISSIAVSKSIVVELSIRINPDIDADTNEKITTGLKVNKFGITEEDIYKVFSSTVPGVKITGLSVHIGSQISNLKIFDNMIEKIKRTICILQKNYSCRITRVDLGGGLGIPYANDQCFPTIAQYSQLIKNHFLNYDCTIICEPGRSLVGNSGILFTKALYCKSNDKVKHVIVDAGMNDFMRTALYNVNHMVIPVVKKEYLGNEVVDIVGPVCESDDIFVRNFSMQKIVQGDVLVVCTTGAYGSSMFNNYNSRPLIAEVLVNDDLFSIIRRRQTYEEMFELEIDKS